MQAIKWGVPLAMIIGLVIMTLWYRADAASANEEAASAMQAKATAVDANTSLMTTVSVLNARNAALTNAMDARDAEIKEQQESLAEARADLDRLSEAVQTWRRGGVPGDIDRLLNPTASGHTCGAAAPAVIAADAHRATVLSRQAHRYQW